MPYQKRRKVKKKTVDTWKAREKKRTEAGKAIEEHRGQLAKW